ncbi:CAP domain-containing protein [Levilactobacillus angrenensis]|uniref:CAP domain-containing protein n=1 Tax=Levilactobacillus angrenensis TaxID=2486020 RepID=A0ABW1U8D6_9LACO|nr:CAP domain-containing protein [Levilactobacillus angrenensis]
MKKLTRLLAVSALTVLVGGGVVETVTPQSTVQAAKKAKAKKAKKTKAKKTKAKKSKAKKSKAKKTAKEKKYYTAKQWSQVLHYRKQAKKIGVTTKGMYAQKPRLKKSFRPGKLSASYINRTVNWINFYRTMFGLSKVQADSDWNTSAQYGAATLAAADKGLSHGLVGIKRPSFVSKADWQKGADATNQSNLSREVTGPYDIVTGYLSDDNDLSGLEPGHRLWILGGIDRVGVGQADGYNDLRVFADNSYGATTPVKKTAFPRAGLMPYALVSQGAPWSVSWPDEYTGDSSSSPQVSVYDKTAKKAVKVTHVNASQAGYGFFGTTVYFLPKKSQLKVNHAYKVEVSGVEDQSDISYTTRLFDLKVNGAFY